MHSQKAKKQVRFNIFQSLFLKEKQQKSQPDTEKRIYWGNKLFAMHYLLRVHLGRPAVWD